MPRAASLADEIEEALSIKPTLTAGSGGIFDVEVDGSILFSKHNQGDRFPKPGEILRLIQEKMG